MINGVSIVEMNDTHLSEVIRIYDEAFKTETDRQLDLIKKFKELNANKTYKLLVALTTDNKVAGFLMTHLISDFFEDTRDFMSMWSLCVDSDNRCKGVATALLMEAENIARKYNCCFITFITGKHRENAHRIYRALGFDLDSEFGAIKQL